MDESLAEVLIEVGPPSPDQAELMRGLKGRNWQGYARDAAEAEFIEGERLIGCGADGIARERQRIISFLSDPDDPDSNYWYSVATVNGVFAGYIAGVRHREDDDRQEIIALHVVPEFTNHGIGTLLVREFFSALGRAVDTLVEVVEHARAIDFYGKLGFELSEDHDERYRFWGNSSIIVARMVMRAAGVE